jgi:hypothetical protein
MSCALAACGGGGVNSGGSVAPPTSGPPPPPPPANKTITELEVSQTLASDAAQSRPVFDLAAQTTIQSTAGQVPLTISYDGPTRSYTIVSNGQSSVFSPADLIGNAGGEARYRRPESAGGDSLTLVTTPYSGTTSNRYVGLGYHQHNAISGTRQDTLFDVFAYGLPTPAGAVPRSGNASFAIDVFGLATTVGAEPRVFEGSGSFDVDLGNGIFSANAPLTETGFLSGDSIRGGSVDLIASGHLSASDGTFAGDMRYSGTSGRVAGLLNGRLYGPGAQEVGAAFSGVAGSTSVSGAFTGQRRDGNPLVNQTLTNLVAPQLFFTDGALLEVSTFDGGTSPNVSATTLIGQLNRQANGDFTFAPGQSNLPSGQFTAANQVPSPNSNFTSYEIVAGGQPIRLDLFRPGPANTELVLTYTSLGRWAGSSKNGVVTTNDRIYFAYGLQTPGGLLAARTGSATYTGIVYGMGADRRTAATYDVNGTSRFVVDFSNQSYSGALAMTGTGLNGAGNLDFGTFDFAGRLAAFTPETQVGLSQAGQNVGLLTTRFYGPTGEEIGGPFTLVTRDALGNAAVQIAGAAVAKR